VITTGGSVQAYEFVRLLRTSSSERHALRREGSDFGILDLHYLSDSTVQATVLLFDGSGISEAEIPDLLTFVDEVLLPEVRLDDKNLTFTVAVGRVLGAYQAHPDAPPAQTL
jgi:hypothetical protein